MRFISSAQSRKRRSSRDCKVVGQGWGKFSFEDEIRELTVLCKEDLVSVNTIILDKLDSNVPLVHEVGKYLILSGGKRLRPLLTVSSFHMTRNGTSEIENKMNHIGLSAAVEFIHTATLLHDDVIDESKQRRGKPTANEKWKNKMKKVM